MKLIKDEKWREIMNRKKKGTKEIKGKNKETLEIG